VRLFTRLKDQVRAQLETKNDPRPRPLAHGPFPGDRAVLIDLLLSPDTFVVAMTAVQVLRHRDTAAVGLMLEALGDPRCDEELEGWLLDAFLGTYVNTDDDVDPLRQLAVRACAESPQARAVGMTRLDVWLTGTAGP
jgi:hypothetical protein